MNSSYEKARNFFFKIKQNKHKQTSTLMQLKQGKETFLWRCKLTKRSFPFQFFEAKLLVWFLSNDTKHLNEFGGTETPSILLDESTQSSRITQPKLPNQKKNKYRTSYVI